MSHLKTPRRWHRLAALMLALAACASIAHSQPAGPARPGPVANLWGAGHSSNRTVRVVVACDPLDLEIHVQQGPGGKQQVQMYFGQIFLPEKEREAYIVGMTASQVAYDHKRARAAGLSDEVVAELRKRLGQFNAPSRDQSWKPAIEAQYHAWDAAANDADRAKVAKDLIDLVKAAGADALSRQIDIDRRRLDAVEMLLDKEQMAQIRKTATAPDNVWTRYYDRNRPQRLRHGVWRVEHSYIVNPSMNISAMRVNGKLTGFSTTAIVRYDNDVAMLENLLTYLASHHDQAKAMDVTREQIGQLRSSALEMYGPGVTAENKQRLRAAYEAWEAAPDEKKIEREEALHALAAQVADATAAHYSKLASARIEEIRAVLTPAKIEKLNKIMTDDLYRRSAMDYGDAARP